MRRILNRNVYHENEDIETVLYNRGTEVKVLNSRLSDDYDSGICVTIELEGGSKDEIDAQFLTKP